MIQLRSDAAAPEIDLRKLKAAAEKLLRAGGRGGSDLSIALVDDASIRRLNREHRGKDKATDVLSFGYGKNEPLLGEIAISVETARRQAADYDAPLQNEVYRLLIHGLLHVLGHDHHKAAERARMEAEERRLAAAIAMPWPYD